MQDLMTENGIAVKAEFVPFSMSRNAKPDPKLKDLSLNWRVTLEHQGHEVMTVDYSAGTGHCESVGMEGEPLGRMMNVRYAVDEEAIRAECEDGKARNKGRVRTRRGKGKDWGKGETWLTMPDPLDVLASLLMDGEAINAGGFESWAEDFGMDTDSRKAKAMYDACVETGLKLRSAFGETLLGELNDAAQDL
jgi:hypothetical protein